MIIFKKASDLSTYLNQLKSGGSTTGFVPTMGALHAGHISLVEVSGKENDVTICSIFVNPTQFNNPDDLKHYPVTLEQDIDMLTRAGCDVLFLPTVDEIYPAGYTPVPYPIGALEGKLEGRFRPGHFQGVCQVVDLLLRIVEPGTLYLGQKDYQQCMVIRQLLRLTGRDQSVQLRIMPTIREQDGLAMSSRNLRLSEEQRKQAAWLHQVLSGLRQKWGHEDAAYLQQAAIHQLSGLGFEVDYLEILDTTSLEPVQEPGQPAVALVAASLGPVRLIDNLLLN